MKVHGLSELKQLQKQLQAQRQARAAQEAARLAAERERLAGKNLFANAVGPVKPLRSSGHKHLRPQPALPLPLQRERDEQAVMQEALSDEFDAETLLHTDDHLSFRRPGMGVDVVRRLRAGTWSIQRQIDLHGLRREDAREALGQFIREAHKAGLRCVRVVHGKGLGSPGRMPVLKGRVHSWLIQKNEVMAFVQARPLDGGAGALVVLLRPGRPRV
ncbi:Smr/MutS family protein [Hydrogenophaga defluvii]|uniref:Smr/MutS family protein n=1 Tax=Hydrogenophaga defluvii TaxID=249410 RepID=A0ABW2SGE0_9BURK